MSELGSVSKQVGSCLHINDVNMTLEKGFLHVRLGQAFAGKASLMRLMGRVDLPTSGEARVDGLGEAGMSVRNRTVAMVYQQLACSSADTNESAFIEKCGYDLGAV